MAGGGPPVGGDYRSQVEHSYTMLKPLLLVPCLFRMMAGGGPPVGGDYRKYDKLLRELEDDSVDTDLLDDELRSLQATEPTTYVHRNSPRTYTVQQLQQLGISIVSKPPNPPRTCTVQQLQQLGI